MQIEGLYYYLVSIMLIPFFYMTHVPQKRSTETILLLKIGPIYISLLKNSADWLKCVLNKILLLY